MVKIMGNSGLKSRLLLFKFFGFSSSTSAVLIYREAFFDNLQYNMVAWWADGTIVQPSDTSMFILIDWEWFGETVGRWLGLRAYQTVSPYHIEDCRIFVTFVGLWREYCPIEFSIISMGNPTKKKHTVYAMMKAKPPCCSNLYGNLKQRLL